MEAHAMNLPKISLTGVPVTALSLKAHVDIMLKWAKNRSSRVVCVANVHMLMESHWDDTFKTVLEESDLVTPDGMPLVWLMRAMGIKSQERVAGMDIFLKACDRAAEEKVSIYLLGCTPDVLAEMRIRLQQDFPDLELAGAESLPFRQLTEAEDIDLVERVNNSKAGLVFLALGCPKQERWMAAHKNKIQSVMIGVGGVFPVYAGLKNHAPFWIRESGLEWLYRLIQEPRRLWSRYQKTIPPFILLAAQQLLNKPKNRYAHHTQKSNIL